MRAERFFALFGLVLVLASCAKQPPLFGYDRWKHMTVNPRTHDIELTRISDGTTHRIAQLCSPRVRIFIEADRDLNSFVSDSDRWMVISGRMSVEKESWLVSLVDGRIVAGRDFPEVFHWPRPSSPGPQFRIGYSQRLEYLYRTTQRVPDFTGSNIDFEQVEHDLPDMVPPTAPARSCLSV